MKPLADLTIKESPNKLEYNMGIMFTRRSIVSIDIVVFYIKRDHSGIVLNPRS